MPITTLDPTTALVAVDLQAGIVAAPVTPIPSADVVARTASLASAFRRHGLPVVLVHVTTSPDGADAVPGRTDAGSTRPGPRPAGFADIVPELGEGIVVTKHNWGAFYGTDLDLQLRRRGVTQVVITGIATSIGVESTARAAHEYGYNVTVAIDAVSDLDEVTHRNSIERIFPRLAETGTTDEILEVLAQR